MNEVRRMYRQQKESGTRKREKGEGKDRKERISKKMSRKGRERKDQ